MYSKLFILYFMNEKAPEKKVILYNGGYDLRSVEKKGYNSEKLKYITEFVYGTIKSIGGLQFYQYQLASNLASISNKLPPYKKPNDNEAHENITLLFQHSACDDLFSLNENSLPNYLRLIFSLRERAKLALITFNVELNNINLDELKEMEPSLNVINLDDNLASKNLSELVLKSKGK